MSDLEWRCESSIWRVRCRCRKWTTCTDKMSRESHLECAAAAPACCRAGAGLAAEKQFSFSCVKLIVACPRSSRTPATFLCSCEGIILPMLQCSRSVSIWMCDNMNDPCKSKCSGDPPQGCHFILVSSKASPSYDNTLMRSYRV